MDWAKGFAACIAIYAFAVALLCLCWLVDSLRRPPAEMDGPVFDFVVTGHAVTMGLTFYRHWPDGAWKPLIYGSPRVILAVRVALFAGVLNLAVWIAFFVARRDPGLIEACVASATGLVSYYMAAHWTLRPERIFSKGTLRFWDDTRFFTWAFKSWLRPSLSFDEWMADLAEISHAVATDPAETNTPQKAADLCDDVVISLNSRKHLDAYRSRLGEARSAAIDGFVKAAEAFHELVEVSGSLLLDEQAFKQHVRRLRQAASKVVDADSSGLS